MMYQCPVWHFNETRCQEMSEVGVCTNHYKVLKPHVAPEKYAKQLVFCNEIEELTARMMRVEMLKKKLRFKEKIKNFRINVEMEEAALGIINCKAHCC